MRGSRRKLKRVGVALHRSPIAKNVLIAKVSEYVKEGLVVYDGNLEKVGVVIETFGPVNSPYARIKLEGRIPQKGEELFVVLGDVERVSWKKMPKRRGKHGRRR